LSFNPVAPWDVTCVPNLEFAYVMHMWLANTCAYYHENHFLTLIYSSKKICRMIMENVVNHWSSAMIEIHEISRSCILTPLVKMWISTSLIDMSPFCNQCFVLVLVLAISLQVCRCRWTLSNCVQLWLPFQEYCQIQ
jgi:hypothetical protein